jgi:hypothetical protein
LKELSFFSRLNKTIQDSKIIHTKELLIASKDVLKKKELYLYGEAIGQMFLDISLLKLLILVSRMPLTVHS